MASICFCCDIWKRNNKITISIILHFRVGFGDGGFISSRSNNFLSRFPWTFFYQTAAVTMNSAPSLLDINVDTLFEQHSVLNIAEIHKKLQSDVEQKKEELRTMVG